MRVILGQSVFVVFMLAIATSSALACFDLFDMGSPKADYNSSTHAGKKYDVTLSTFFTERVSPLITQCINRLNVYEGGEFSLVMQVSKEGKIEMSADRPTTPLSKCLSRKIRELLLPAPPWQAYWIKLNYSA